MAIGGPVDQWSPDALDDRNELKDRLNGMSTVNELIPAVITGVHEDEARAFTPFMTVSGYR